MASPVDFSTGDAITTFLRLSINHQSPFLLRALLPRCECFFCRFAVHSSAENSFLVTLQTLALLKVHEKLFVNLLESKVLYSHGFLSQTTELGWRKSVSEYKHDAELIGGKLTKVFLFSRTVINFDFSSLFYHGNYKR